MDLAIENSPRLNESESRETIQVEAITEEKSIDISNLNMLKLIGQSKFPVFLVEDSSTKEKYVLKLFPYKFGNPHPLFQNEIRTAKLTHANIVSTIGAGWYHEIMQGDQPMDVSYVIQEYARNGDFFDFVCSKKFPEDDQVVRTYIHQLVEGVEFLHKSEIAHCDLKMENLILSDRGTLQILDFDLSRGLNEAVEKPMGSYVYRAPELRKGKSNFLEAADIYSIAIIMFVMKSRGELPYLEVDQLEGEIDLYNLLLTNPEEFWEYHAKKLDKPGEFFDDDFKNLFMSMTKEDPSQRPTIDEIKESKWYTKVTLTEENLLQKIHSYTDWKTFQIRVEQSF